MGAIYEYYLNGFTERASSDEEKRVNGIKGTPQGISLLAQAEGQLPGTQSPEECSQDVTARVRQPCCPAQPR